ncbi:MAG: substrate-binding domain-containing protein [Clostridia bacterium]|nr:substrate-binding domain-containing protein [Clostridia bacterium]
MAGRAEGLEQLVSRKVDGIILMGSTFVEENDEDNAYIRQAAEKLPIVILNATLAAENVYGVIGDQERTSAEAVKALIDSGCQRILYLYHSQNHNGRKKLAGYRDALTRAGIAIDEALIRFIPEDAVSVPAVRDTLEELYSGGLRFDAVFTSEDELAAGAIKFANSRGLKIPEDISIIGYNNTPSCLFTEPELSSVDVKLQSICRESVRVLLSVLNGQEAPQTTVFAGSLIRRGSTR